jgi:dTDP-4-amino-4,6-dideoxygalactose transaminase
MTEFNAVLGLNGLETMEIKVACRNKLAEVYMASLKDVPGISFQEKASGSRSNYKDLSIMVDPKEFGLTRDVLAVCLEKENIKTKKYYYPPVHRQKFITSMFRADENKLKVTNHVSENIISLPMFSHMDEKDVVRICDAISNIYKHRSQI